MLQEEISESVEFEKEAFVEAVREMRCLWDLNHPMYKDRTAKQNAWKKLSAMFSKDSKF